MKQAPSNPCLPNRDAPFEAFLQAYMNRKNWNQTQLAENARLNQAYINKLCTGRLKDKSVDRLVCVCLALQLSLEEAKDLLARAERAFSPASETHGAYQKLIALYAARPLDAEGKIDWMDAADRYLEDLGFPPLPNCYD